MFQVCREISWPEIGIFGMPEFSIFFSSTAMPVQVFPPLTLEPRNITLIIGAKFQVQVSSQGHS
jgi:hypothetical protein